MQPKEPKKNDEISTSPSVMEEMEVALEKVNQKHCLWIWAVFLLTSSPGMFNAHHIMVSQFYAFVPPFSCKVPELEKANWSLEQIYNISNPQNTNTPKAKTNCTIIDWDYDELAKMDYKNATEHLTSRFKLKPKEVDCKMFHYYEEYKESTVVSEWDLVCGNTFKRSTVQGSIAVGKLIGGFLFGFLADKLGRKIGFIIAAVIYIFSGPLAAVAPNYIFFVIVRLLIGVAGAGVYETGFTLLAEVISKKRRSSMGCVYSLSYPVGYMTLPVISYFVRRWRHLQLAISLPMLVLIYHCWFLPESPRWLLTRGKSEKSWNIIKKIDKSLLPLSVSENIQATNQEEAESTDVRRHSSQMRSTLLNSLQNVFVLFSAAETCKRMVITAFANFVAALIYYVLALNAPNFGIDQHVYTFISGVVEVPGYISPLIFLRWLGRNLTSFILYLVCGLALLLIMGIEKDATAAIMVATMIGRFSDVAVFALIILYTSELFPTVMRNAAVGSSLATSQLGSVFAPYIVDYLSPYGWYIPSTLCGITAVVCAAIILLLPETGGRRLLDTLEEMKTESDKVSLANCCKSSKLPCHKT